MLFIESANFTRDIGRYMSDEVAMSADDRGTLFERLSESLREAEAFTRGDVRLRTSHIPGPPPEYSPAEISRLRRMHQMSPECLAQLLSVSPKTVRRWEEGTHRPGAVARRLLQLLEKQPEAFAHLA